MDLKVNNVYINMHNLRMFISVMRYLCICMWKDDRFRSYLVIDKHMYRH